jgi:hypothetical protein
MLFIMIEEFTKDINESQELQEICLIKESLNSRFVLSIIIIYICDKLEIVMLIKFT